MPSPFTDVRPRAADARPGVAWAALLAAACVRCASAETPRAATSDAGLDAGVTSDDAEPATGAEGTDAAAPATGVVPEAGAEREVPPDSSVPCSALPLCDGFEGDAPGGPPSTAVWSIAQPDCSGSGALGVDGSVAHSGTHSVRVDGGGGYCDHVFIANAAAIAGLGPQLYARLFVRFGTALGAGHVTFLAMKDSADKGGDLRMGGQDMILMYNRQSDDATLPVLSPTGTSESVVPAVDAWTCVEFHVDETAGTIDTWVDGKEVSGLVEDGTPVPDVSTQWLAEAWKPALTDFRLGWESYSGQTMTLWFDDVALGSTRIGCDNL